MRTWRITACALFVTVIGFGANVAVAQTDPTIVFATNVAGKSNLYKLIKSGTDYEAKLLDDTVQSSTRLVLDTTNKKIYWVDWKGQILESALGSRNNAKKLVPTPGGKPANFANPTGIAFDGKDTIYWTENLTAPGKKIRRIRRMKLGTENVETLYEYPTNKNLEPPMGIEIDPSTKTIYWAVGSLEGGYRRYVQCAKADGSGEVHTLITRFTNSSGTTDVAIAEHDGKKWLYFTSVSYAVGRVALRSACCADLDTLDFDYIYFKNRQASSIAYDPQEKTLYMGMGRYGDFSITTAKVGGLDEPKPVIVDFFKKLHDIPGVSGIDIRRIAPKRTRKK